MPDAPQTTHALLLAACPRLPTDYTDYGGQVDRWADENAEYPDCSMGCRWAAWLKGDLGLDWCVCTKAGAPRFGLLTFEHMTGKGCFESKRRRRWKPPVYADPDTVEYLGRLGGDEDEQ